MKKIFTLISVIILITSCKKNSSPANVLHKIGDSYQGGIVAYILQPGDPGYDGNVQHGLIAATQDQSTGIAWWTGTSVTVGDTSMALGTVKQLISPIFILISSLYLKNVDSIRNSLAFIFINETIFFISCTSYWKA